VKLLFLKVARKDIREANSWYEKQKKGLGEKFVLSLRSTLQKIEENPQLYQRISEDLRRAPLSPSFPHFVFYRLRHPDVVQILAVLHPARDPSVWQDRL
jgi:toxin ParE1/3/4